MRLRSSRRSPTSHGGYGDDVSARYDAVILGLGIHGSASAYELARRGLRVAAIERFPAGHTRGSSHGATRMIRRAYPHPDWNEFVRHAYRGWERWERQAGRIFVHRTAGVYAHRSGTGLQGGRSRPASLDEVAELLPGLRLPDGYHATFDPDAGVVEAGAALAWAHDAATDAGAELSFGETVLGWAGDDDDGMHVTTDRRELLADRLVVAGGPWLSRLLPGVGGRTEVWRILTYSARPGQAAAQSPALGAFSVDLDEGLVFGLPEVAGAGAKVGVDAGAQWDPESPVAPPTAEEAQHLAGLLARFAPAVDVTGGEAAACLYTMTPDKRFVIGSLADRPGLIVAAACSGHGFKFGPAVGEAVADLVEGIDRPDLDFLRPDREALR
jgi:glycine/D-amino acid oxidase-like deaminating enzyme